MSVPAGSKSISKADLLARKLEKQNIAIEPGMIQLTYDPSDESCILSIIGIDDSCLTLESS